MSAQTPLKISGRFLNDPGVKQIKIGILNAQTKEFLLGTAQVERMNFTFDAKATGMETYFLKYNENMIYFDLGPGIADIILKDSTLKIVTIQGNKGYDDMNAFRTQLRADSNFTNNRRDRARLDSYRRAKLIDSAVLKQKENAFAASELKGMNTQLGYTVEWIKTHPYSFINSKILFEIIQTAPEIIIKDTFKQLPDSLKKDSWARLTEYWIDSLSTGGKFPETNFHDRNNKILSVNSLLKKGKYTLVDFWASWCVPCRQEMPLLASVYSKYSKNKFQFISVSLDQDRNAWLEAIKTDKLKWTQLAGEYKQVLAKFLIPSIPSNLLLDANGKIVARNISAEKLDILLNAELKSLN
ncbi:TlpA family protein disulfide reductase [Pedobacter duraquae]|uniref:TlpA family protein disulfide reductase n=1 Tax=Pedobacter duraquae TaxID=425511 RepID=UPI001414CF8F|nr:TlpA disulfide reductase family protein [Pedobacter duraquae]